MSQEDSENRTTKLKRKLNNDNNNNSPKVNDHLFKIKKIIDTHFDDEIEYKKMEIEKINEVNS
jgi:hypothetical protein